MAVAALTRVRIYFPLSTNLASTAERIQVLAPQTAGEIESSMRCSLGARTTCT